MIHFYNENNPYRAAILRERIHQDALPQGVVDERAIEIIPDEDFLGYNHIHLFAGIGGFPLGLVAAEWPGSVSTVTGGFPCQDISNCGTRTGISGSRSRLWREMVRCIRVVRPQYVFVENVAALLNRGMGDVLGDLAEIGYDARADCVSAADVGAPHIRRRIFIVAHALGARLEGPERGQLARTRARRSDANASGSAWRNTEPKVDRVVDGLPQRMDRLAALGDACVPQCVEEVIRRMAEEKAE